ncbi:hypothetical protein X975_19341, partial [Stegodyphus mimosarum]
MESVFKFLAIFLAFRSTFFKLIVLFFFVNFCHPFMVQTYSFFIRVEDHNYRTVENSQRSFKETFVDAHLFRSWARSAIFKPFRSVIQTIRFIWQRQQNFLFQAYIYLVRSSSFHEYPSFKGIHSFIRRMN